MLLRANNLFSCAIDAHLMHGAARWRGLPLDGTYPSGRPGRRILERRVSQQTASQMPTPAPPANCSPARLDAIWHLIQINRWQAIFEEHPDALTPASATLRARRFTLAGFLPMENWRIAWTVGRRVRQLYARPPREHIVRMEESFLPL